ncbi:MAG TPA: 6-phosphogluconolactonase [Candidatus Wallbacteria bacterium]|nr:6-phosphogluconolactonase [Candidatus Wallbacteria bacterium]
MRVFRAEHMLKIEYREDRAGLYEIFSAAVTEIIVKKQSAGGKTVIGLSGGSTPALFYKNLAENAGQSKHSAIRWDNVSFFLGDERHAAPDSAESNFGNAVETLCSGSAIPKESVRPLVIDKNVPKLISADYEKKILSATGGSGAFDLVILGMGADGHTASLFAGTLRGACDLNPKGFRKIKNIAPGSFFISHYVPEKGAVRYTLTPEAILTAEKIIMLVTGSEKASALRAAVTPETRLTEIPAAFVFQAFKNGTRPLTLITDIRL